MRSSRLRGESGAKENGAGEVCAAPFDDYRRIYCFASVSHVSDVVSTEAGSIDSVAGV